ncbi:MAG: Cytochrome c [Deltaproteobacteria bacterium]|nr:Cytochrome c [Deltaproteobacteria bacterium]
MHSFRVLRLCAVKRLSVHCGLVLIVLLAGCGRNERMDTVYTQRCLNCHGVSGRGDGPMAASLPVAPPDFRQTVEKKGNPQIRRLIADGKGLMPAFEPALSASEINDMLQMVRFLSREGRQISWWEKFDALVVAHCSIPWEAVLGYDEPSAEKKL